MNVLRSSIKWLPVAFALLSSKAFCQANYQTKYFNIQLDNKGYVASIKNTTIQPNVEFAAKDHPSPIMALYNSTQDKYYYPIAAKYSQGKIELQYANGSQAIIKAENKSLYVKLTLQSLTKRENINGIQWGSIHTTITNLFGELIGVARDTSASVNYAIGLLALNDATTGGPANTVGDVSPFEYVIHTPDKNRFPLPADLQEGQHYSIGGEGINDVAFYSHPEEYYRILYGNAATVDSTGRISIVQHASDRTKPENILFSLMPKMESNKAVHQERQAIPGVDYIGSSVALWGSPDSIALMTVIKTIVLNEKLPYPTIGGKWVKDPARYKPDVFWSDGNYDSTVSYAKQLGFRGVEGWNLGEFYPNRSDNSDIKLMMPFAAGKKPVKYFTDISNANEIAFGLHTLHCFLQPNISSDVSPVPSDSLCYLQKRILIANISATDTVIVVNDSTYLNEIAGWEAHPLSANVIKIGKEIIYYNGVSKTYPFTLLNVKRGYWKTAASPHTANDTIYKLQSNCYHGAAPNIFLQDLYADYYATLCKKNGMHYIDFDGEEDLYYQGHGEYSVKRFYNRFFTSAKKQGIDLIRVTGATLSAGAWHYHSIWNVGGGDNMYRLHSRTWGIEGKDLRNVTYSSYFPSTFGGNFELKPTSTVQEYENVQALSVGLGVTYVLSLSEKTVEACANKYAIFNAIKTWENARAANAFPKWVKQVLSNEQDSFHLEAIDANHWNLYKKDKDGSGTTLLARLKRDANYPAEK